MHRGFKDLLWYIGIVEDNYDPLKLGRVKVRAFGIHSEDKGQIPTEDLPWATLIVGTYNMGFKPPKINAWVFGFFIDGDEAQHPMVLGIIPGIMTELPSGTDGQYGALDNSVHPCDLNQPDISRLARGEYIDQTYIPVQNAVYNKPVMTAAGEEWTTPGSSYNASYPHNQVLETDSGHVVEIDDTPGSERINIRHASGSRVEFDSVGNVKIGSSGDVFIVTSGNENVAIAGSQNITVDGNVNLYAKNNLNMKVDGNLTTDVHGDYNLNVAGIFQTNVGSGIDLRGSRINIQSKTSDINILSGDKIKMGGESIHMKSGDVFNIQGNVLNVKSEVHTFIDAGGQAHFKSGALTNITSGGALNLLGSGIARVSGSRFDVDSSIRAGSLDISGSISASGSITAPNINEGGVSVTGPSSAPEASEAGEAEEAIASKIQIPSISVKSPVYVGVPSKVDTGMFGNDDEAEV